MKLLHWRTSEIQATKDAKRDPAALDAISRGEKTIAESVVQLKELHERRVRLEIMRRQNHLAPAILEAFRGKE